jgi:hypothetical protein
MPIAQRRSEPDLKGVGQRDFLAQRLNASVSFLAGQLLVEQFWLVRLDREATLCCAPDGPRAEVIAQYPHRKVLSGNLISI